MNIECCVCTEAFLPSSVVNTTPCGHMFHGDCLSRWLVQSKTCPQCRKQCTPAQLIKMYFNVAANSGTTGGNGRTNERADHSSLEKKLDNLTLKFREQEALLKTLKNDAAEHKYEQQKMSKTVQDLEKELRTKNENTLALNRFGTERDYACTCAARMYMLIVDRSRFRQSTLGIMPSISSRGSFVHTPTRMLQLSDDFYNFFDD